MAQELERPSVNGPGRTLLFYVVSPVHVRNLGLLAGRLGGWSLRVLYSPRRPWFTPERIASYPYEWVPWEQAEVPRQSWEGDVRAVVLSTAQVGGAALALIKDALVRSIPTVAVEEVNQLALQDKVVNNYILPVDWLLVASEYERDGFIEAGMPASHVEVTGWPFYSGLTKAPGEGGKAELQRRFALDPSRPVATLSLSMFAPSDLTGQEGPETRRHLMTTVARGLPGEYQLLIKAHPAEDPATVVPFVKRHAPRARLLDQYSDIQDVLQVSDVLFNQGISQVVVEALLRELPVVVVPVGARTAFDGLLDDLVVHEPSDVPRALSFIGNGHSPMKAYDPFWQTHMAVSPERALEQTARRIEEIARSGDARDEADKLLELAIWQAALMDRDGARDTLGLLARYQVDPELVSSLQRLVWDSVEREEMARLSAHVGSGLLGYAVKSLWIDALCRQRMHVQQEDMQWLSCYPPKMMGTLFLAHAFRWAEHLVRCGHRRSGEEHIAGLADKYSHLESVRQSVFEFRMLLGKMDMRRLRPTPKALSFVGHRLGYYGAHPMSLTRRLGESIGPRATRMLHKRTEEPARNSQ